MRSQSRCGSYRLLFTCLKNLGTKNVQKRIDLLRHPPQDTPIYANLAVKVFVFNFVR